MERIAVLLTCYNRVETTLGCLRHLFKTTVEDGISFDVFLVDDLSPDRTGAIVKESFPSVHVIEGTGKLFWNRGMALAWKTASESECYDYYLWLNDDVFLEEHALTTALRDYRSQRPRRGNCHQRIGQLRIFVRVTNDRCTPFASFQSTYVGTEKVAIQRLDSIAQQYLSPHSVPFLKIDTQGYEWQVLDGAKDVLDRMRGILCELSIVTLYEGQHLWEEMIQRMKNAGFTLWYIQPAFMDRRDGRTLQIDACLFRP